MEQVASQITGVDDDEDLEQLRLAALKSLKKPVGVHGEKVQVQQKTFFKNGLNRNRGSFHGRMHRNGQFNHRTRNANLIAVPLISTDAEDNSVTAATKLVLPQDRYCKSNSTSEEKSEEQQNSKFSRYDNSDSESESDDEEKEIKSPKKLEKANSLEALMQELENEIEGKSGNEEKVKVKKAKKRVEEVDEKSVVDVKVKEEPKMVNSVRKTVQQPPEVFTPIPTYVPPPPPVLPYYQPTVIPPPYNTLPPLVHYEPPVRYERIPSPLPIDTDLLNTTVTAPLSPRSAAFVLQNREIIERRKRRSYSRSPSPRYRRSRTKSRSPLPSPPHTQSTRRSRVTTTPEKKNSVYERLGTRVGEQSPSKKKRSRSKSPKLDPVLEARKKKFESNELKIKEGVIRLKPKNEQEEENTGTTATTEEQDDVIDVNVDDLFSDEETDNENEGRFKGNTNNKESIGNSIRKSTVVSFAGLTNKENEQKKRLVKKVQLSKLLVRTDKQKITPPVSTLPEKKIEIKIRNPTKYEEKREAKEKTRKVEIGPHIESGEIVDNDENEDDVVDLNEGDLRAQLSRKRAERQSKISVDETVASRLLQSALESAVFKKVKSTKTKSTTKRTDGKLPIHSRLGVPVEAVKKKRKRNKRSGGLEQV